MAAEAGLRIPPVEVRTLGYPDVAVNMLADPALAVFCSLASTGGGPPYHLAAFTGAAILNPAVTLENTPVVDTEMDERSALLRVLNDFVARPDMNPPRIAYLLGLLSAADVVDLQTDKHQSSRFDLTELKRLAKLAGLMVPGIAPLPERDPQHPLHPHRHDSVWYDLKSNLAAEEDYTQCWTVLSALQQHIKALALDLEGAAHVLGASPDHAAALLGGRVSCFQLRDLLGMAMTAGMADEHVRLDLSGYKSVTSPMVDGVSSDRSAGGAPQVHATVRIGELMAYMSI